MYHRYQHRDQQQRQLQHPYRRLKKNGGLGTSDMTSVHQQQQQSHHRRTADGKEMN